MLPPPQQAFPRELGYFENNLEMPYGWNKPVDQMPRGCGSIIIIFSFLMLLSVQSKPIQAKLKVLARSFFNFNSEEKTQYRLFRRI